MRLRVPVKVVGLAAGLTMALAAVVATGSASASGWAGAKTSSAGQPQPLQYLLCGTTMGPMGVPSGSSTIDHFNFTATGNQYPNGGTNCSSKDNTGMDFTWTIGHGNVQTNPSNPRDERGTEHGIATLSGYSDPFGVNGQVTDYDFPGDPISCGNREIYYASGHAFDPCGQPSAPGNTNTHGGANTGAHFHGKYGTIIYTDSTNGSNCQPTSMGPQTYCFEAVLNGQQN
jgi:hypothetical protein